MLRYFMFLYVIIFNRAKGREGKQDINNKYTSLNKFIFNN